MKIIKDNVYFKKFKFLNLNLKKMLLLGNHLNYYKRSNVFFNEYILNLNFSKSKTLNIDLINKNVLISLNFMYSSLINGARLLTIYDPLSDEKIKIESIKLFFIKQFFFNNTNKLFIQKFKNGLLTNYEKLQNRWNSENCIALTTLEKKFLFNKRLVNKTFKWGLKTEGLIFFPDLIFIDQMWDDRYINGLNVEISKLKIPYIALSSFNYQNHINDIYYVPNSQLTTKSLIYFWIIFVRLVFKSLLFRKNRFKIKSLNSKIVFKENLFNLILNKQRKKASIFNWSKFYEGHKKYGSLRAWKGKRVLFRRYYKKVTYSIAKMIQIFDEKNFAILNNFPKAKQIITLKKINKTLFKFKKFSRTKRSAALKWRWRWFEKFGLKNRSKKHNQQKNRIKQHLNKFKNKKFLFKFFENPLITKKNKKIIFNLLITYILFGSLQELKNNKKMNKKLNNILRFIVWSNQKNKKQ